jgi:hypothetical protein
MNVRSYDARFSKYYRVYKVYHVPVLNGVLYCIIVVQIIHMHILYAVPYVYPHFCIFLVF